MTALEIVGNLLRYKRYQVNRTMKMDRVPKTDVSGELEEPLAPHSPSAPPTAVLKAKGDTALSAQSLHEAAERGNVQSLLQLLAAGKWVDAMTQVGTPPCMLAERGHVAAVVEGGAMVAVRGALLRTPLHLAATEGHVHVVCCLVERGAALDQHDAQDETPLTLAAARGQTAALEALLLLGADPNISNEKGQTPLFRAVEAEQVKSVKLLLEMGADIDAADYKENSPLLLALISQNSDIVQLLIKCGASPIKRNTCNESPLTTAAQKGFVEVFKLLLKATVDPKEFEHCLLKAGNALIVWHLLNTPRLSVTKYLCLRALRDAASMGRESALEALTQAGYKSTEALIYAAKGAHVGCLQVLLGAGTDPNGQCYLNGNTALHLAAEMGNEECVWLLLDAGADVKATNNIGWTALHFAAFKGAMQCVQHLINAGANVNASTGFVTPLTLASGRGHKGIVCLLQDKEERQ